MSASGEGTGPTRGPYALDASGDTPLVRASNGFIVAEVNRFAESHGDGRHLANGRLLAASWLMAEALRGILSACEGDGWEPDELRSCVASHARGALGLPRGCDG